MSLILEALRKSEAERQRDGAPNVAMELPPVPPRRDGVTPAWVWPTLAVVVVGAALAGWLGIRAGKGLQTGDAAAHAPVAAANTPASASTSAATTTPPPPATPAPAPQPPTTIAAQPAQPAPPAPPAPAPLSPLPTPAPTPAPADAVRAAAHAIPPPPPLPVAARPAPAPAPAAPAITPDPADAPPIGATGLPPVKLSMHMWDADPGKRFVILDGQRMGEGDRNGALQVIAILRNGVIIERAGIRARVPLP